MTEKVSVSMKKFRVVFKAILENKSAADIHAMGLQDDDGNLLFQKPSAITRAMKNARRVISREMGSWQERLMWSTMAATCQLRDHYHGVNKALRDPSLSNEERLVLFGERRGTIMSLYEVGTAPSPVDLLRPGPIDKNLGHRAGRFADDAIHPLYKAEADRRQ